jgi:xanthine/uracil permease
MVPILIGAAVGYIATLIIAPDQIDFGKVAAAPLLTAPHLTPPDFTGPLVATAVFSIAIMFLGGVILPTLHSAPPNANLY